MAQRGRSETEEKIISSPMEIGLSIGFSIKYHLKNIRNQQNSKHWTKDIKNEVHLSIASVSLCR